MALKKEIEEVRYTEQIGVNRGSGFAAMADASLNEANQLNDLTSRFADAGLKELQTYGLKVGKEAAENATFSRVEKKITLPDGTEKIEMIPAPVPKLAGGKFFRPTVSMQEAYDKNIYDKYNNDVQSSIRNVIIEERANIIKEKGTGENFNTIVNARLEPLLKALEPKYSQVAQTYKAEQQQQHWYQVEQNYLDHRQKIENLEYTNILTIKENELESLTINGASKSAIDQAKQEIIKHVDTYKDMGNDNALATGELTKQQLENNSKAFTVLQKIIPNNMISLSANEQSKVVNDLLQYEQLLQGGVKSITLSNGDIINNTDVPELFNKDAQAQKNMVERISRIRNDYNSNLDAKMKENNFNSYIAGALANAPTGMPPDFGTMSKKEIQENLQINSSIELLASGYNRISGVTPITTFDPSAYNDLNFVKYVFRTTNQLPFFIVNQIEKSFEGNNQQAIQSYFNNGLIPSMQNMTTSFVTKKNGSDDPIISTMQLSNLSLLGLNETTIAKINTISNYSTIMPINEAIDKTVEYHNKLESNNIKVGNFEQLLSISGSKTTSAEINKKIFDKIINKLDESWTLSDPIFSTKIYELVKTDVYRTILNGNGLINKANDVNIYIDQALGKIMSPDSQYGFDKYTFTPFLAPNNDKWNDSPEKRFVYLPVSKFYSLPNNKGEQNVDWMKSIVEKLSKSSLEYKAGIGETTKKNENKFEFGKEVFLQPTTFVSGMPQYNLVHLNKNDIATILTDGNGIPIIYDPRPDYLKLQQQRNGSKEFESTINQAKQNRITFLNDNRILDSGITVAQERILKGLEAQDILKGENEFTKNKALK